MRARAIASGDAAAEDLFRRPQTGAATGVRGKTRRNATETSSQTYSRRNRASLFLLGAAGANIGNPIAALARGPQGSLATFSGENPTRHRGAMTRAPSTRSACPLSTGAAARGLSAGTAIRSSAGLAIIRGCPTTASYATDPATGANILAPASNVCGEAGTAIARASADDARAAERALRSFAQTLLRRTCRAASTNRGAAAPLAFGTDAGGARSEGSGTRSVFTENSRHSGKLFKLGLICRKSKFLRILAPTAKL